MQRSFWLLLALSLTFLAPSCKDSGDFGDFDVDEIRLDVPDSVGYIPNLDGPLRLLAASPTGSMSALTPGLVLSVTFSKPMVELGDAPRVPDNVLRIRPAVAGKLQWEGTQTLVFVPDEPLQTATRYDVVVASGIKALDGEALARSIHWTFETPRPTVVRSIPYDNEQFIQPAQRFGIQFNQAIDKQKARPYIVLVDVKAKRRVPLDFIPSGDSSVVLKPFSRLRLGTDYELQVHPGLPPAEGRLFKPDTTRIRFKTYNEIGFAFVGPELHSWQTTTNVVKPNRHVVFRFTNPVRFGEIRRTMTFKPAVEWPVGIEAQDAFVSTTHTLLLPLEPETGYTATVKGLKDSFGQTLASASLPFRTTAYDPDLQQPTGLITLESDQKAGLPMRMVNVPEANVSMQRLRIDQIIPHLKTYDGSHYYGETKTTIAPPPGRTLKFANRRNKPAVVRLRLDTLLTSGTGVVGIAMNVPALGSSGEQRRTLAVVTSLGITGKFSPHQSLFFVTRLATARPVAGAAVSLRDENNRVLWRGKTDGHGKVAAPGWSRLGLTKATSWEDPRLYAFVEQGNDLAFTSNLYNEGVEPYRFNIDYEWSPRATTNGGSVFTDRGLYRAGETVHFKGVLRRKTDLDWQPLTNELRVLLMSPREQVVYERLIRPSALGTFHFDWTAPTTAVQGDYRVRVMLASDTSAARRSYWDDGDVAYSTFRVDAFRRATFEVDVRPEAPAYVSGDFFEADITGRYLFGADMAGQPVRYVIYRETTHYTPPGFEAYSFGSYDDDDGGQYDVYRRLTERDTLLGPGGTIRTRLQVKGSDSGAPTAINLSATVTDPARQTVSARTSTTLHPALFYVGLKPTTTFINLKQRKNIQVDVVTVDPNGRPIPDVEVDVALIRVEWNSIREVGTDGRLRWKSERRNTPMGRHHLTSRAGVAKRVTMPISMGGSYVLRAESRDRRGNKVRTDTWFYAAGTGYVGWERTDDDRIDLVADKNTYQPGETARVMVQSPYEAATALVTLEREGVLSSTVVVLKGSAPMLEIPLSERHLPNVFVSVVLLNGRSAKPGATTDAGKPGFKMGYATLRVDSKSRHLNVEVKPASPHYRPGETATVDLSLTDQDGRPVQGEVTFSAADAGVVNLIGYTFPDPFDAFYGPRPLGVKTTESRAVLVDQRDFGQKEEDIIGGGGDAGYMLRKDFRPSAHWAPALRTGKNGRVRVTFRVPESLTTFRLMAAAVATGNRFGSGMSNLMVTQPLVLTPALPRFVRPGDTFEAGVLVSNLTGASGTATISARAVGLRLTGPAARRSNVVRGGTQEVRFRYTVPTSTAASLRFDARLGSERDAFTLPLIVRPPMVRQVSGTFSSTEASVSEAVRLPADRVPGTGRLEVRLSSSAMVGLDGAARYLFTYPYGCLEQRTSAIRPYLLASDLIKAFKIEVPGKDRESMIQAWIQDLPEFWMGSGFSMWTGRREANPFVSAYVVLALAEAREAGYDIPTQISAQAVEALAQSIRNRSDSPSWYTETTFADTQAMMLYALARHGRNVDDEIISRVQDPNLSVEGVAWLLRAVRARDSAAANSQRATLLQRLNASLRLESTLAYAFVEMSPEMEWVFSSSTRATALALAALVETNPDADTRQIASRMIRYLMQQRSNGYWASTQENAAVVDALDAYYDAYEKNLTPNFRAEVQVAGKTLLEHAFSSRSLDVVSAARVLPNGSGVLSVNLNKSGRGLLYYSLLLESFSNKPQAAAQHGLMISRSFRRLNRQGRVVGAPSSAASQTFTAGDLLEVTLRVTTPTDRTWVVVDDALPAGLEVLNAAFETTDRTMTDAVVEQAYWSFNHSEIRDDRVVLFSDRMNRGEHAFVYLARATTRGHFVHPPARAEMMYVPEVNGQTASGIFTVR